MSTPLSPETDTHITQKYSAKTLDLKAKNKTALQSSIGWPEEPKRPVVCFPSGMSDELGGALLKEVIDGLLSLNMEILILGKGSESYGQYFTELAKKYKHRISIVPAKEKEKHAMIAASDVALFLAAPSANDVAMCLAYGVVPVAPSDTESLDNYNPIQESGNAFTYDQANVWQCFTAVVRSMETFKFPFDWRTIQKHCMSSAE